MASRPACDIFDRNPDPALDELTEVAAVLGGADFAYIGLMEFDRLWFKSRHGFSAIDQPRSATACRWTLDEGRPILIADATADPRFPPGGIEVPGAGMCRSYAGAPLVVGGRPGAGTLAILSRQENQFSEEHLALLDILGRQVTTHLELYDRIQAQERAQRAQQTAERALAVERSFVAATLDSIPALLVVTDTAGRIVRMNHPCIDLIGSRATSVTGRFFVEELLEEGDRGWAATKLCEASAGQSSGPHETRWRIGGAVEERAAEESRLRRVSWTVQPLKGPRGEIQFLVITGKDVTDQRQAELALLSSEARYREVVEGSLGFVFTCSMDGRLTSLNSFTAETLGYRAVELLGRGLAELVDTQGAVVLREGLRMLSLKEEWQGSLPLRRSDGEYRRIALRSRRMELPGDRPFILSHGMDVTELHEAEAALHLAMRQRELILESVDDGIFGVDLSGRITFANQAAANALRSTREQLAGCDAQEALHHSRADSTPYARGASPILRAMTQSEAIRMRDEVFWRRDGTAIHVEYNATPLIQDRRISGMVVAFQDVSERRRLDKMKDEFISTVSHELRTPLTSLRASLGLIFSGSLDKRPEKQRQMVGLAIENCDRLIGLVNNILDFDSVERGELALKRKMIEAVNPLRRAADVAHAASKEKRINVELDAKPVAVYADEERILQVLNELVTNAIKFSAPDTAIKLSVKPYTSGVPGRNEVCFAVEDQGRGIPAEKLERIFERFQQGDASDSRALGGTGLGLALCKRIVEQHKGRIWAESTVGKGSRFLFTLPATPESV